MRIALLTLESALSTAAVGAFLRDHGDGVALIGRSVMFRPSVGGPLRQAWHHLRRSGPRLLPYLWVNYGLPDLLGRLRHWLGRPGALARFARQRGIPLVEVAEVNALAFREALRQAGTELIVTFHFDQILSAETLAVAPLGGVNVHPSLLPYHRGPVPTIWARAEAPARFGVTVHRLVPRIDAGAILAQQAVALPGCSTASAAARALHAAGVPLLAATLRTLASGVAPAREAPPLPYCPFPPPAVLRAAAAQGGLVDVADLRAALGVAA